MHLTLVHGARGFHVTFDHTGISPGSWLFRVDSTYTTISEESLSRELQKMVALYNAAEGPWPAISTDTRPCGRDAACTAAKEHLGPHTYPPHIDHVHEWAKERSTDRISYCRIGCAVLREDTP